MNAEKIKKRNKIIIILLFIFGLIGIAFLSYDFILGKIRQTYERMNLKLNIDETPKEINQNTEEENQITQNTQNTENIKMDYIAYLKIPKIGLTQGLVSKNSKYNNVDMNIQIINPSDYPNVNNGNLILAAHSGTSYIAYFKNLYKINNEDEVIVIYNNKEYNYKIANIYTVPKNGNVPIYRDMSKTTITLITCTKDDEATQTVYIGYKI